MRLIDADELVKLLKTNTMSNGTLINTNTMIAVVEKMPTAYDIEKVVEELVNKIELYRIREIESLRKGEPINVGVNLAKQASIEDCIEVVRRGGVE